jgi:hypothetical protein
MQTPVTESSLRAGGFSFATRDDDEGRAGETGCGLRSIAA